MGRVVSYLNMMMPPMKVTHKAAPKAVEKVRRWASLRKVEIWFDEFEPNVSGENITPIAKNETATKNRLSQPIFFSLILEYAKGGIIIEIKERVTSHLTMLMILSANHTQCFCFLFFCYYYHFTLEECYGHGEFRLCENSPRVIYSPTIHGPFNNIIITRISSLYHFDFLLPGVYYFFHYFRRKKNNLVGLIIFFLYIYFFKNLSL